MKRLLMILFMILIMFLLYWGGRDQAVIVHNFTTGVQSVAKGQDLIEKATFDGYILYQQQLYDANSLMPASMSSKDCPT